MCSPASSTATHSTSRGIRSGGAPSSSASAAKRGPLATINARTTSEPWPGMYVAADRAVECRASSGSASSNSTERDAASS